MEMQDFSRLPETAWIQIFQYLPLLDRYRLSVTCRRLNAVMNDPILWRTMDIHLPELRPLITSVGLCFRLVISFRDSRSSLPCWYLNNIRRFGKNVQTLTVKDTSLYFCDLDIECLRELSTSCELQSLTLDIGKATEDFLQEHVRDSSSSALTAISSFVRNARRLRHLHIRSWPIFENINNECNIFKTITQNEALKSLETLTLFMPENPYWTVQEFYLVTKESTYTVVSHLKNLTHIGLIASMISQEIINLFVDSERARLKRLDVFIHGIDVLTRGLNYFPKTYPVFSQIDPATWKAVCDRNPELRIHITVSTFATLGKRIFLFGSTSEVASITYLKESTVHMDDLNILKHNNRDNLTSVKCYTTHYSSTGKRHYTGKFFPMFLAECEHINEFVYHGKISAGVVKEIAKVRGNRWKRFEVVRDLIMTCGRSEEEEVAVVNDRIFFNTGDYYRSLVSNMKHHKSEQDIQTFSAEVSKILGYEWKPKQ